MPSRATSYAVTAGGGAMGSPVQGSRRTGLPTVQTREWASASVALETEAGAASAARAAERVRTADPARTGTRGRLRGHGATNIGVEDELEMHEVEGKAAQCAPHWDGQQEVRSEADDGLGRWRR